jgi:hypothetical protein
MKICHFFSNPWQAENAAIFINENLEIISASKPLAINLETNQSLLYCARSFALAETLYQSAWNYTLQP